MNKKILAIGLILLLAATVFSGCTDHKKETKDANTGDTVTDKTYTINTNYPRDRLGLNENGEAAFTAACDKYSELKEIVGLEDARTAIVDELNSDFEFVKEASLSEDGYTIAIIFEDETAALIMTDEGFSNSSVVTGLQFSNHALNNEISSNINPVISKVSSKENKLMPVASDLDSSDGCEVDFVVPKSKKVLIINALTLSDTYWANYQERVVESTLTGIGWDYNDINTKKRTTSMDGNLTPEDFFEYSGYGMVIYMGHGGYCSGYEGSIPGHHYLQCCNYGNYTKELGEARQKQYLTWRDQGRLIVGAYKNQNDEWAWEYYIDSDLIKEKAEVDSYPIIYTISCNSYRIADAFLDNGAGCFFGWDYKADGETSSNAFIELINGMYNGETSITASEALNGLSSETRTSNSGGFLQLYDNDKDAYLPSFGKIKLQPSSPPDGTSYYQIEFLPYGTVSETTVNAGEEVEYDGVSPVDITIVIKAMGSAGNIEETGIYKPVLLSGKNELITITKWNTYGIILTADPIKVDHDGTSTSTVTATLKTWLETDITEPTGQIIQCKEIEFFTNLGFFTTDEKVFTDSNGQATVKIASNDDGTATIRAIVEDDEVESFKNAQVTFGDLPYSFRLISWDTEDVYDSGYGEPRIIHERDWRYWLAFDSIGDTEYYEINLKINGQEYVFGGFREDQEYVTDGKLQSYWTYIPASWNDDYDNGTRFLELGGATHSAEDDGTFNTGNINQKQTDLLAFLNGCTFEIQPYTDY